MFYNDDDDDDDDHDDEDAEDHADDARDDGGNHGDDASRGGDDRDDDDDEVDEGDGTLRPTPSSSSPSLLLLALTMSHSHCDYHTSRDIWLVGHLRAALTKKRGCSSGGVTSQMYTTPNVHWSHLQHAHTHVPAVPHNISCGLPRRTTSLAT